MKSGKFVICSFSCSEAPKISPFAFDGDLKEGDRSQVGAKSPLGDVTSVELYRVLNSMLVKLSLHNGV